MTARLLLAAALLYAPAAAARAADAEADPEAPAVAWPVDPEVMAKQSREFKAAARAAFLDPAAPLPDTGFPFSQAFSEAFAKEISELVSLAAQVAYVRLGRGPEDISAYADMVAHVAARLGIDPPESALPRYRGRTRPADQPLTPQQEQGFSELTEAVSSPEFRKRFLYVADIYGQPPPPEAPAQPAAKARQGRKKRRAAVQPPPEPKGPTESVLEVIDWKRAEELADAAPKAGPAARAAAGAAAATSGCAWPCRRPGSGPTTTAPRSRARATGSGPGAPTASPGP